MASNGSDPGSDSGSDWDSDLDDVPLVMDESEECGSTAPSAPGTSRSSRLLEEGAPSSRAGESLGERGEQYDEEGSPLSSCRSSGQCSSMDSADNGDDSCASGGQQCSSFTFDPPSLSEHGEEEVDEVPPTPGVRPRCGPPLGGLRLPLSSLGPGSAAAADAPAASASSQQATPLRGPAAHSGNAGRRTPPILPVLNLRQTGPSSQTHGAGARLGKPPPLALVEAGASPACSPRHSAGLRASGSSQPAAAPQPAPPGSLQPISQVRVLLVLPAFEFEVPSATEQGQRQGQASHAAGAAIIRDTIVQTLGVPSAALTYHSLQVQLGGCSVGRCGLVLHSHCILLSEGTHISCSQTFLRSPSASLVQELPPSQLLVPATEAPATPSSSGGAATVAVAVSHSSFCLRALEEVLLQRQADAAALEALKRELAAKEEAVLLARVAAAEKVGSWKARLARAAWA